MKQAVAAVRDIASKRITQVKFWVDNRDNTRGGINDTGTVFQITAAGTLTTLHGFTGGADGGYPLGGVIQGSDGNFYGTTSQGGANRTGTVFQITTAGTLTTLFSFTGGSDGAIPRAGH